MHIMCAKERNGATVRMRVREIIKMHLDSGMIRLDTPVIIMDLPAGKKIEAGVMDPKVMEYMEREAGGCKWNNRTGLCITIKGKENVPEGVELDQEEQWDTVDLLMELVAKSQMQQTLFDVLKALDEWEYPYESVTAAKGKLRVAVNLLGNDMEGKTIHKILMVLVLSFVYMTAIIALLLLYCRLEGPLGIVFK